jgi:hypothetical protein
MNGSRMLKLGLLLGVFLAAMPAFPQSDSQPSVPHSISPQIALLATARGCLIAGSPELYLATGEHYYRLTGSTSTLAKYNGKEIILRGMVLDGTPQHEIFEVNRVVKVIERPEPKLASAFSDFPKWKSETNEPYGIRFSHPDAFTPAAPDSTIAESNFVSPSSAVALASYVIPRDLYPNTNFAGGAFAVLLNPKITNAETCEMFQSSEPESRSRITIGGIRYATTTEGDAGMNQSSGYHEFHTFQNGFCYEVSIVISEYSTGAADDGCAMAQLNDANRKLIVDSLLARISFFLPGAEPANAGLTGAAPEVTSFTASTQTADDAINHGQITLTWSAAGADYVQLSYKCSSDGFGVVISEDLGQRRCENAVAPGMNSASEINHGANSSTVMGFANFDHVDPISIVVTAVPFSRGIAFPAASKSLTITVDPHNPFMNGIPTDTRNLRIAYAATGDGASRFMQGSSIGIHWSDARPDPCVNLYLVQDDARGGLIFRSQLVYDCLKPASSGSYAWTVTDRFSGGGFRILGRTPGGTSNVLGPPFSIVASGPDASNPN